jgi:hypothetical protein
MKEPYGEGPASHTGPESCVCGRKDTGEALTGVHAGQPLSCEINQSGMPTLCLKRKATPSMALLASHVRVLRSLRT